MALRTKNYAYNVVDPRASMFCDLFKTQFKEQEILADKIGRHIRGLGYKVPNLSEKLRFARIDVPKVSPHCSSPRDQCLSQRLTVGSMCNVGGRMAGLQHDGHQPAEQPRDHHPEPLQGQVS